MPPQTSRTRSPALQPQEAHRGPFPRIVHPEAQQGVHEVVAGGHRVEVPVHQLLFFRGRHRLVAEIGEFVQAGGGLGAFLRSPLAFRSSAGKKVMKHKCLTARIKIPPAPLFQSGVLKSPFEKGGFRGILLFAIKPAATKRKLFILSYQFSVRRATSGLTYSPGDSATG